MIKDKITSELKRGFIDAIEATVRTGKEHSFLICKDKTGDLRPTKICEGTECHASFEGLLCPKLTQGDFHTHPDMSNYRKILPNLSDDEIKEFATEMASAFNRSIPDPGHQDLVLGLLKNLYKNTGGTVCVGSDGNTNIVSCWTVKNNLSIEEINRALEKISEETKKGEKEEYENDWIDSYFDKEIIYLQ